MTSVGFKGQDVDPFVFNRQAGHYTQVRYTGPTFNLIVSFPIELFRLAGLRRTRWDAAIRILRTHNAATQNYTSATTALGIELLFTKFGLMINVQQTQQRQHNWRFHVSCWTSRSNHVCQ